MSESVSTLCNQPIGQMFGLFGCSTDANDEVVRDETQEVHTNEQLIQSCQQNTQINENECIICKNIETKYKCPKCQTKTCSLSCCRRHKIKFNCNGVRDKTSFVKLSDYSQQEFLSDYFFLEEVDTTLDTSCRERRAIISSKNVLPKWIQKLVREARNRGTYLKIMPAGFKRRKQNTTCFMYSKNTINWDIELTFVHSLDPKDMKNFNQLLADDSVISHSEMSFTEHRVCETTKLLDFISKYIEFNDLSENDDQKRRLVLYSKTGINGISVLFRTENRGSNQRKYIELDLNKTIKDNMSGKTIIEFPTLLVVLNQFKHLFDIISDEKTKRLKTDV